MTASADDAVASEAEVDAKLRKILGDNACDYMDQLRQLSQPQRSLARLFTAT